MLLIRFVFCDCCLLFVVGEVGFDLRFCCLRRSSSCCLTMIAIDFSASSSSRSICVWREGLSLGLPVGAGGSLAEGRVCCIELGAELFSASCVKPTLGVSPSTLIGRGTGAGFVDSNWTGGCEWLLGSLSLAELVVGVI